MELNEKQVHILELAESLFAKNGFDGTSIRQITKEANVNVSMISYYFGSKEGLLNALLDYRILDLRSEFKAIIAKTSTTEIEKMDEIIAHFINRIHGNRNFFKIMDVESYNGCRVFDNDNYIKQRIKSYKVIEEFVKKGQINGVFSREVDVKLIVPTIIGTYLHFYHNVKFFKVLYSLKDDNQIDEFVKTTLTQHLQITIKALLTYEK